MLCLGCRVCTSGGWTAFSEALHDNPEQDISLGICTQELLPISHK